MLPVAAPVIMFRQVTSEKPVLLALCALFNMVHTALGRVRWALLTAPRGCCRTRAADLYGPWIVEGIATAPSNLAFDAD